jgi:hypothetical protein
MLAENTRLIVWDIGWETTAMKPKLRRVLALGIVAVFSAELAYAQRSPFTKAVADRIRKVEDGVDEFRKYLDTPR